jgi:hypothetical protein
MQDQKWRKVVTTVSPLLFECVRVQAMPALTEYVNDQLGGQWDLTKYSLEEAAQFLLVANIAVTEAIRTHDILRAEQCRNKINGGVGFVPPNGTESQFSDEEVPY